MTATSALGLEANDSLGGGSAFSGTGSATSPAHSVTTPFPSGVLKRGMSRPKCITKAGSANLDRAGRLSQI